jgi:hypothetical protein
LIALGDAHFAARIGAAAAFHARTIVFLAQGERLDQ